MRDCDDTLVGWVYTMNGLDRTDEALQYLDDQPHRIKVWLDERRKTSKLYVGSKKIKTAQKHAYEYEGEIDMQNLLACGWGTASRYDGATYTGLFYLNNFHGIGKFSLFC